MSKLYGYLQQRFSLHDGSGIRSTLFLKGCPLSCDWCQNPESISPREEMCFNINNCIGCGVCLTVCDFEAIDLSGNERITDSCTVCGECSSACPNKALEKVGWERSVEEIAEDLLRDESFYDWSGGGVTISGGEPLLQSSELNNLLRILKNSGIHTLIETSAHVPWSRFEDVLENCDEFFIDVKSSSELHEELTGVKQEDYIIPNIKRLSKEYPEVKVSLRMPVIPGINDGEDVIDGISKLLRDELDIGEIELLQFHRMYESKIDNLVETKQNSLNITPSDESVFRVHERFSKNGITSHLPEDLIESEIFEKPKMTERVTRLLKEVKYGEFEICVERVRNLTEFYKNVNRNKEEEESSQIIRAKMLDYLLEKKEKFIYDEELIVGNYASNRVSGNLYMELHGLGVIEDLLTFGRRETNPWKLSFRDRWEIIKTIPFWMRNNILVKELGFFKFLKLANRLMRGSEFVLNEAGGFVHFCPSYERLLASGTKEIAQDARKRKLETDDLSRRDFYDSVIIVCESLEKLGESYAVLAEEMASQLPEDQSKRKNELLGIAKTCRRIPALPPTNLQEALQCIVIYQLSMFQESIDLGIAPGRLDIVLYPYYKMTKEQGLMNDEEILELLCCFWIKLGEVVPLFNDRITNVHGGLFNGQTINVGGLDSQGVDCTNELSYIFLEVADAMRTRMPNFYLRYSSGGRNEGTTKRDLLSRASRMIRDGAAMPALANDKMLIDMLTEMRGVELEDARDYILLGCVEPVIAGKSYYSTDTSLNNLPLCLERSLHALLFIDEDSVGFPKNMEDVFDLYQNQLELLVSEMLYYQEIIERSLQNFAPTPLTSVSMDGCIESGVDACLGGTKYDGSGHQGVGSADLADSFSALEHVVFNEKRCSLKELVEALEENFESEKGTIIRGYLLQAPKYGNDDEFADKWMTRVMKSFSDILTRRHNLRGGQHVAGWYSVTIHDTFGRNVGALPSGREAHQPFSSGISPTSGSVREGPTASLKSAANIEILQYCGNGVNFNLMLQDSYLKGENGVEIVQGLLEGYFNSDPRGIQVQFNVMDPEILKEARDDPTKHIDLLVRVSGYSAYFRDLTPMVREEIVQRYCKKSGL